MLLAIDIGNTNITFGIFKGNKIIRVFDIPTKSYYLGALKKRLGKAPLSEAIICSVVPAAARVLKRDLNRILGRPPLILGKDTRVPIKNRYRDPGQVGQDRLVNAYAGVLLFGSPLVIVDFGTAITLDIISKDREYLGGMILPGLDISLEALAQRTALLPRVKLERPAEFIGQDTQNSMLSGVIHGFSTLVDGLVIKIKREVGKDARVIATGGNASVIAGYCSQLDKVDRELTLKGLNLIYQASRKQKV